MKKLKSKCCQKGKKKCHFLIISTKRTKEKRLFVYFLFSCSNSFTSDKEESNDQTSLRVLSMKLHVRNIFLKQEVVL